ncbi:MAG: DUF4833 domain-containing protein [Acidobacteriia bacterium]|nr:DUF4833 domain-containing protein [Terriglobia bacterium]
MIAITPMVRTWLAPCIVVVALPATAATRGKVRSDPNRLFVVQRSVNANIVVYDAVRGDDGHLDPTHPVAAYWLMNADKGQREELNVLEKAKAYGFEVAAAKNGSVMVTLKALQGRSIEVRATRSSVLALTRIAGREAVLRRVYVQTEKDHPTEVKYIELIGQALRGRKPVREKIAAG